jgi:hypothetical protein
MSVGCCAETRLVEVKGPSDSLSDRQHAWIARLRAAGVEIEVALVRPDS